MPETQTATEVAPGLPSMLDTFSFMGGMPFQNFFMVLNSIWNTVAIISFILSGLFIYGMIYAMFRTSQLGAQENSYLREQERLFAERKGERPKNSRWLDVLNHIESGNPNDWRLAIIEADIILDEALSDMGLAGNTIGEKLKSASSHSFATIDDAWNAHLVRNKIAHAGQDFVLTQKLARETINQYTRVFKELGKV